MPERAPNGTGRIGYQDRGAGMHRNRLALPVPWGAERWDWGQLCVERTSTFAVPPGVPSGDSRRGDRVQRLRRVQGTGATFGARGLIQAVPASAPIRQESEVRQGPSSCHDKGTSVYRHSGNGEREGYSNGVSGSVVVSERSNQAGPRALLVGALCVFNSASVRDIRRTGGRHGDQQYDAIPARRQCHRRWCRRRLGQRL